MRLEVLWDVIRSVPPGRCAAYGAIGRALPNPATGFQVGRWMAQCPEDVPWWRVVSKDGTFPIDRRHPGLGLEQRTLLEREGVVFNGSRVDMSASEWEG